MIRARAGTTGSVRPLAALIVLGLGGLLLAACSSNLATPSSGPTGSDVPGGGSPSPSASIPAASSPAATDPLASPDLAPVLNSSPSPSPTASGAVEGSSTVCSGSSSVRDFFSDFAQLVDWSVYCAVAPQGWSFESGEYRLKDGGHMTIAYKGPQGAHVQIQEGGFCRSSDGCVPSGSELGSAPFGDRMGSLLQLDGGGLALVVDRGSPVSWLAIGGNVNEDTFRTLCANLHLVDR